LSRPYYHHNTNRYCGFYYPRRVTYAYVPYGFYGSSPTVYIDVYDGVRDDYVVDEYEAEAPTQQFDDYEQQVEMRAAAGSAAAERYMREATEYFASGEYPEAARRFRLAAIAAPNESGPLFALGQSLIALKNYPYAAKVIRRAIDIEPTIVREGGDLVGVYGGREEFDRISKQLEQRISDRPEDLHAPFLLGVQQYFSGDPAARATFAELARRDRSDRIVAALLDVSERRFETASELPPTDPK